MSKIRLRSDEIIELAKKYDCALFHGEDMSPDMRATLLGMGYLVSGNRLMEASEQDNGFTSMVVNITNDVNFEGYVKNLIVKYLCMDVVIRVAGSDSSKIYKVNREESACTFDDGHMFCGINDVIKKIAGERSFSEANHYNLMTRGYFFEKYKREFLEEMKK